MRANEFVNEGWYDDAKAKVKSVNRNLNRSANKNIKQLANVGRNTIGKALGDFQQTNAAHAAAHTNTPLVPPKTGIGTATKNFINQDLKPGLAQIGSAWRQGVNAYKQGAIDREASKNFAKKFLQQIEFNRQAAQRQGVEFNLKGFVNGYLQKYHWQPGALKAQLDKAVAANDLYNLPKIMAQVGKANTSMQGGQEIQGAFGPTPAQPSATAAQPAAQPTQKQQTSQAAKQINNKIPRLNNTDVTSVKQTADTVYAQRQAKASMMPQSGTLH